MADSSAAASATLRVIGPAVSWASETGTTPARLTRPSVGLRPTIPQALAGQTMLPSVSVPTASGARLAATAARRAGTGARRVPVQRVRVDGLATERAPAAGGMRGAEVGPLRQVRLAEDDRPCLAQPGDQPGVALPGRRRARASRPWRACPLAAMLSLISTGMPASGPGAVPLGPQAPPALAAPPAPAREASAPAREASSARAASLASASLRASALTLMTARRAGFSRSIRPR